MYHNPKISENYDDRIREAESELKKIYICIKFTTKKNYIIVRLNLTKQSSSSKSEQKSMLFMLLNNKTSSTYKCIFEIKQTLSVYSTPHLI